MLTIVVFIAISCLTLIQMVRSSLLIRLGNWLDRKLAPLLFAHSVTSSAQKKAALSGSQHLQDLAAIKGFLTGPALNALLDAPWSVIFIIFLFFIHPVLGAISIADGIFLLIMAIVNELKTKSILDNASEYNIKGAHYADIASRNAEAIEAMGMIDNVLKILHGVGDKALAVIESAEARHDRMKLAIIAETVRNYIKLRQVQKQRALVLKNIKIQQDTLDGVNEKRKVGAVTDLEVVRAEAQVEDTKVLLTGLDTDIASAVNRLHVLSGEDAAILNAMVAGDAAIPAVNDGIVVSTPLKLVEMHPDIRAAERELASRTALSGAAFANMFPKISIDGFFNTTESNLFGAANPWSLAGNLVMPVLNFGALKAEVEAADARQEQAFEGYKQAVLFTLEEVRNAFTSYNNEKKRKGQLGSVFEKRKNIVEISEEQYKAGNITQLDLLLAQQNQLDAENSLVISEAKIAQDAVAVYEAMGVGEKKEEKGEKERE